MIISGLLWFLLWPGTIVLTYLLVKWALKKFEKKLEEL